MLNAIIRRIARAAVPLGATVLCAAVCACGSTGADKTHALTRPSARVALSSEAEGAEGRGGLFSRNCAAGATVCLIILDTGKRYVCTGHPHVTVEEEVARAFVEHATCRRLSMARHIRASAGHASPACSAATTTVRPVDRPESEATQEESASFILTNSSHTACVLYGYPRVSLYDRDRRLPFINQHGNRPYLIASMPRRLLLDPGVQVYFKLAKGACETGLPATEIRVALPGGGTTAATLTRRGLGYCRKPFSGEQSLQVSAIAAAPDEV